LLSTNSNNLSVRQRTTEVHKEQQSQYFQQAVLYDTINCHHLTTTICLFDKEQQIVRKEQQKQYFHYAMFEIKQLNECSPKEQQK
jgi:hypothetical protein